MSTPLPSASLEQSFLTARTYGKFTDQPVSDAILHQLYDLAKWGPTSMNCQPGRFVFVRSPEAKAKLKLALSPGNVDKTLAAPVTVIVAMDSQFFEHLPEQFPAMNAKPMFENNAAMADGTAFRNSSLQGAYLILAARQLGLDCGPMSGFDAANVNEQFFPDGRFKANFLVNMGYGVAGSTHPRGPRLPFETACSIA